MRTCALIHVAISTQRSVNTLVDSSLTSSMDRRSSLESLLLYHVHEVHCAYHKLARRSHCPHRGTRAVAILIWLLSRNPDLAVLHLQTRLVSFIDSTDLFRDAEVAALTMLDWFRDVAIRGVVLAAITSLEHQCRHQADSFLLQTCLVDFIVAQNQRGLTVDQLLQALHVYLRLWSHRALSDRTAMCLRPFAWHRNSRRRFGVALRCNFLLCITTLPPSRELNREELVTRVLTDNTP